MTDIHNTTSSSNSAYSYISIKYWCYPCQRQFSQLCADNTSPSPARCPRCILLADPLPRNTNNSSSSSSSSFSSQPEGATSREREGQEYVYYTQQMMDPFGRIFLRTFRVPINRNTQANVDTNTNANPFAELFGNLFYPVPMTPAGFGLFGGLDERLIEEFLRNDPNQYGPAPASQEAINRLQEVKFEHTHQEGQEGGAEAPCCSICQEDYKEGENLVRLPCKHEYHKECVGTWLSQHNSCPMCRQAI